MNIRKIWHILPEGFRKGLSEKTGFQDKIIRYGTRRKAKAMKQFKDIAVGKRCFIVGNGPSLTIEDLEKIKDEDSFACNYIFKIFDQTNWRPTYYAMQDTTHLERLGWKTSDTVVSDCKAVFLNGISRRFRDKSTIAPNEFFFYCNGEGAYEGNIRFSDDITKNIFEGSTVTYTNIQLAVYMGYSEIYLIGVDHNYPSWNSGQTKDHTSSYMKGVGEVFDIANPPVYAIAELAYTKGYEECTKRNIKICNATRGGKLEVYPRVDFDSLF